MSRVAAVITVSVNFKIYASVSCKVISYQVTDVVTLPPRFKSKNVKMWPL